MIKILLQLHVLGAVEKRLKQSAVFSVEEIRHDVEVATGDTLAPGADVEITEILRTVPGLKPVHSGQDLRWSKTHNEPASSP